jgi:hypothetical protein
MVGMTERPSRFSRTSRTGPSSITWDYIISLDKQKQPPYTSAIESNVLSIYLVKHEYYYLVAFREVSRDAAKNLIGHSCLGRGDAFF